MRLAAMMMALPFMSACESTMSQETVTAGYPSSEAPGTSMLVEVKQLPPPPATRGGLYQPISAGDVLKVSVFEVPDLDRTVQVDSAGDIALPLIGPLHAAGQTVRALETEIAGAYGARYLQSPDVSVFVTESAGQRVTVEGSVKKAGIYPIAGEATLLQMVAQVGGLADTANPEGVYVFRSYGNRKLVAKYSVADIQRGKAPDPRIYGGDMIVAFDSSVRVAQRNLKDILASATGTATLVRLIP